MEQKQISVPTPGLFDKADAFIIDFATMRPADYCFPLPVGKAKAVKGNMLEITATEGDEVKAMFDGTVRLARHISSFGNVIVVRHDNGLETVYGNNAQNLVSVGQHVEAGQTIAVVGSRDGQAGCTFAIMVNGGCINPATLLNPENHRLLRQTILCKKAGRLVSVSVLHSNTDGNATDGEEEQKKQIDFDIDPFADGDNFSINFANLSPGEWCYPLQDSKVISRYGIRNGRRHTGVDLKTKPNDEIHAAFDGVVTMSQRYYAYGNYIKIKHANGIETCYSHNSKNLVSKGDTVRAGQVIALTGRTGRATTEHLHFECRINGITFDPAKIFDYANHSIKMELLTFTKRGNGITIKSDNNYMAKGK